MLSVRFRLVLALATIALARFGIAQEPPHVTAAVFGDPDPITPEITTEQLQRILAEGRVPVLDTRSAQEYAIAHIPGSRNLYEKELEQILAAYPDTATQLVLYCNGPYCGKSRRLSAELVKRGYTGVRRYQLGMPVWRALGNTVQTDIAGIRYILKGDRTAVMVDARSPEEFRKGSLPGAVNVGPGEAEAANEDGRLPKGDKGTRVIVFANGAEQARAVAAEIAHKAYWNSSYFGGSFRDLAAVARQ
jgi:rhodanese-related sulfurtransferase